jgi:hypothetical protein
MGMLSKSSFMQFLRCSCELWLYKQRPDLAPAYDADTLRAFATGNEVDGWAMKLYPKATNVMGFGQRGAEETRKAIAEGAKVLIQPTFIVGNITCRADILKKNSDDSWDLLEVKSTTQVKPEHMMDMAFQRICLEDAGLKIRKTAHVHIDKQYVRQGAIDPEKLFARTDVTHEVEEMLPLCRKEIPRALTVLDWGTEPNLDIIKNCTDPAKCEFRACILKAIGEVEEPIVTSGKPGLTVNKPAIKSELDALEYPLYFLDYETYGPAIPPFDGYRPYQQCPFQYSVHILKKPGAELEHVEFIMDTFADPATSLVEALAGHIGPTGSVIVWHMSFEAARNAELARMVPKHDAFLSGLNERMFDLKTIVSKGYYDDSRFGGSASLKKVLPVMCPELSYDALAIHEGGTASASWPVLTDPATEPSTKTQLRKDMLAYCELDTLAMVEIYKKFLIACG